VSGYEYTKDWFHWAPEVWTHLATLLPARQRFLEIGSFEGRSAVWTIENMMDADAELVCVDTWEGGEEHTNGEMLGAEALFDRNIGRAKTTNPVVVTKIKETSYTALTALAGQSNFDFVYIDGSHIARDVLLDACLAWPLLKDGGVLVFDDYLWGPARDILHRPKVAVDAFVNTYAEELEIVHCGYQLAVRKLPRTP
jgi:predicted O-methyltransferase YrrM